MRKFIFSFLFISMSFLLSAQVPGANRNPREYRYDDYDDYDYEIDEERIEVSPEQVEVMSSESPSYSTYRGRHNWSYYYENGKRGLKINDTKISGAIYDAVVVHAPFGFIVKVGNNYGFVDSTAKSILAIEYEYLELLQDEYLNVRKDNKMALFDLQGNRVIKFKYKNIFGLNDIGQLVVTDKKDRHHLITLSDKKLYKDADNISLFSNGAIIEKEGKYAFFNRDSHSDFEYDELSIPGSYNRSYRSNYNRSRSDLKNPQATASKLKYSNYLRNKIDVLNASKNELFGLIDTNLQEVVPIVYNSIRKNTYPLYYELNLSTLKGLYIPINGIYIKAKYEYIQYSNTHYYEVTRASKHGILDISTGKELIEPQYDDIDRTSFGYIITEKRMKGLLDTSGNILLPVEYSSIRDLAPYRYRKNSIDLFETHKDGKAGVYTSAKGFIIPVKHQGLGLLNEQYILVQDSGKFGLYNLDGEIVLKQEYDFISKLTENRGTDIYIARKNNKTYLLDSACENIMKEDILKIYAPLNEDYEQPYDAYHSFASRQIILFASGKSGVIDFKNAEMTIPALYDAVIQKTYNFRTREDLYLVKLKGKYGIINHLNEIQVPIVYDSIQLYQNESSLNKNRNLSRDPIQLVAQKNGKFGLITEEDSVLLSFEYNSLGKIGTSLYKAKKGKYYKLIDEKGKVLNEGPFDDISQFEYLSRYDDRTWLYKNHTRVALTFYQGKMREVDEKGLFLTKATEMKPHSGYGTLEELKSALTAALNSPDDKLLKTFVQKVCFSDHILYWTNHYLARETRNDKLPDYNSLSIQAQYYEELIKFKRTEWNDSNFNKEVLDIESFSTERKGVVITKHKYNAYENKVLNNIIGDCIKINGYWISAYFLRLYGN